MKLYHFDANLRTAAFNALAPVELAVRARLGHALGRVDECAHLDPRHLGARAAGASYDEWRRRYDRAVRDSREDFVAHHRTSYGAVLPVWAAVEVLDWGGLTALFGFATRAVQDEVAGAFSLTAPQLESWLKSLNILRNVCAHHGRLFNRVFALSPKLPSTGTFEELDACAPFTRTFGMLSLVQFLLGQEGFRRALLPAVVRSFPAVGSVSISHVGAPADWHTSSLWA